MENIQIGDKLFYVKMSEYRMADATFKIEARINEVKIDGTHKYKEEDTRYIFTIGEAMLNGNENDFFATEEEARNEVEEKKKAITIKVEKLELPKVVGPIKEEGLESLAENLPF